MGYDLLILATGLFALDEITKFGRAKPPYIPLYCYFVRTGNKLNNAVILRSAATKDLRFFAATSFRLRI